jgi:hypothetical protein
MVQNVSTAVMQRRVEADDSLDDFPTPSWSARALIEHVIRPLGQPTKHQIAWEPACNRGYMVRALEDYFFAVCRSDVHDYGLDWPQHDFLMPYTPTSHAMPFGEIDWIITNPPFRLGEQFVHRALDIARQGVAVIVRSAFLEGGDRYKTLFSKRPPSIVAQHVERVIMTKGIVRDPSKKYWCPITGKRRRPSTATSYCWIVWLKDDPIEHTRMVWIPPCRKQMERPGDYPDARAFVQDQSAPAENAAG